MKLWLFVIKFIFIGALFIVSNGNLHLANPEEFSQFRSLFYEWLSTLFQHSKQITGYVVNSEWLPDNNDFAAPNLLSP